LEKIMIQLTDELRKALSEHPDVPVRLVDAATQKTFVIIPAEMFDRLTSLFSNDLDPRIGMAVMNRVMEDDDKEDPLLESYQPEAS
jgi:hypothetical protein